MALFRLSPSAASLFLLLGGLAAGCHSATDAPPTARMTARLAGAVAPDTIRGAPLLMLMCGSAGTYNLVPSLTADGVEVQVGFRDPRSVGGPAAGDTVPILTALVQLRPATPQQITYSASGRPTGEHGSVVLTAVSRDAFGATFRTRVWPDSGSADTASIAVEGEIGGPLPRTCWLGGTPPP